MLRKLYPKSRKLVSENSEVNEPRLYLGHTFNVKCEHTCSKMDEDIESLVELSESMKEKALALKAGSAVKGIFKLLSIIIIAFIRCSRKE